MPPSEAPSRTAARRDATRFLTREKIPRLTAGCPRTAASVLACAQAPLPVAHELLVHDLAWSPEGDALLLLDKDRFCVCFLSLPAEPAAAAPPPVAPPPVPSSPGPPPVRPDEQRQDEQLTGDELVPPDEEEAVALAALALEADEAEALEAEALAAEADATDDLRPLGAVSQVAVRVS